MKTIRNFFMGSPVSRTKEASHGAQSERPGIWLVLARVAVMAYMLLIAARLAAGLPALYLRIARLEPNKGLPGWSQAEMQKALPALDLSPQVLAGVLLSASLFCLLIFWSVTGLLFWLKRNSWIGLLSAYVLWGNGVGFSFLVIEVDFLPAWMNGPFRYLSIMVWPTLFLLFYLFPDGHFVPRWTRFLAPLPYLLFLFGLSFADNNFPGWAIVLLLAYVAGGGASQVYRYRKASNLEQRQQTKWIVFSLVVFIVLLILSQVQQALLPGLGAKTSAHFLFAVVWDYLLSLVFAVMLPLSIAASILRYRLWDIDVFIRKTLVYTALTGLLVLVYFGGVLLLQGVFVSLGDEGSPAVIVLSTLASAAMFNPLRKRVQAGVDRRFYRSKYDAEQVLASFAATARDEVDVERLNAALVAAVEGTVQPVSVTLWLKGTKG